MKSRLILLLSSLLLACGDDVPHYTVFIPDNATGEQQNAVILALNEWSVKTNNVFQARPYIVPYKELSHSRNDTNMIYVFFEQPEDPYGEIGECHRNTVANGSYIQILPNLQGETLYKVSLHELGHAMQLDHEYQYKAIMQPRISKQIPNLQCADLRSFCIRWHCPLPQCTMELFHE